MRKAFICHLCKKEYESYLVNSKYCSITCKGSTQTQHIDVNRVRQLYIQGKTQQQIAIELGTTQKVIYNCMRRNKIKTRVPKNLNQLGDKNSNWKGDSASYKGFQARLYRKLGNPKRCDICDTEDLHKKYDWTSMTKKYEDINDYKRLCRSCNFKHKKVIKNIGHTLKDLTGKKFGILTVRELTQERTKSGSSVWIADCECGNVIKASSDRLQRGKLSCGCKRKKTRCRNHPSPDEAAFNLLFISYKGRSDFLKREFRLSKKEFIDLVNSNCHYCEAVPSSIKFNKPKDGKYIYNGIDRINSSIGYILSNCVPCCTTCNRMKLDLSVSNFISQVHKIARHRVGVS